MAFQIRAAATCRLVNLSTGSTPGRLFQISTSRGPGHWAASAASSCELLKVSVPSRRSSIFCGESKTVMLLSTFIVNVIKFLSSGLLIDDIHPLISRTCKGIVRLFAQQTNLRPYWTDVGSCLFDLTVSLDRAMDVWGAYTPWKWRRSFCVFASQPPWASRSTVGKYTGSVAGAGTGCSFT